MKELYELYQLYPDVQTKKSDDNSKEYNILCELIMQQLLNAELIRICNQQKNLLAQQSGMIEEMLTGMGRD